MHIEFQLKRLRYSLLSASHTRNTFDVRTALFLSFSSSLQIVSFDSLRIAFPRGHRGAILIEANRRKLGAHLNQRISMKKFNPKVYAAVSAMQQYVDQCGLEPLLLELIKLRASQINGCAYCLDMHTKDA